MIFIIIQKNVCQNAYTKLYYTVIGNKYSNVNYAIHTSFKV